MAQKWPGLIDPQRRVVEIYRPGDSPKCSTIRVPFRELAQWPVLSW